MCDVYSGHGIEERHDGGPGMPDLMSRWTNERWVSTLHRVTMPPPDQPLTRRQSMAFFHNINPEHQVRVEAWLGGGGAAGRFCFVQGPQIVCPGRDRSAGIMPCVWPYPGGVYPVVYQQRYPPQIPAHQG
jgi:hypothetical protein